MFLKKYLICLFGNVFFDCFASGGAKVFGTRTFRNASSSRSRDVDIDIVVVDVMMLLMLLFG